MLQVPLIQRIGHGPPGEQSGNYSDKLNFPAVESPQESMQKLQIILINMLCDSLLMILNALLMQTSSFRI